MAQANAQIGIALSAYYPVLTLTGENGYNSISLATLFSKASHFWSYGFQLAQTLFDGGYRRSVVDQAEAIYLQTVAQYRQTVLTAFQNVEDNLVSLRILEDEVGLQEQALETAQETLRLVLNQYKAGTASLADVLNAEVTVYTASKNVNNVQTRQMTSAVGLVTALGGGWRKEILANPQH
jgi:outer membrane protein TolC